MKYKINESILSIWHSHDIDVVGIKVLIDLVVAIPAKMLMDENENTRDNIYVMNIDLRKDEVSVCMRLTNEMVRENSLERWKQFSITEHYNIIGSGEKERELVKEASDYCDVYIKENAEKMIALLDMV